MSEWKPIDSAPKDGTWILACEPGGEWARVSWGRTTSGSLTWCSARYHFRDGLFTHWQPLPTPPE